MLNELRRTAVRRIRKAQLDRYKRMGLQIADDCILNGMPAFSDPCLISLGPRVQIGPRVTFLNHDGATWVFTHRPEYRDVIKYGRITVLENCFIGYGSIIMPGVTIGPYSVVAAGSVVTKDVPANTVAGGNPAKFIMSVDDYAERSRARCPDYDVAAYQQDPMKEVLRHYPRPW